MSVPLPETTDVSAGISAIGAVRIPSFSEESGKAMESLSESPDRISTVPRLSSLSPNVTACFDSFPSLSAHTKGFSASVSSTRYSGIQRPSFFSVCPISGSRYTCCPIISPSLESSST